MLREDSKFLSYKNPYSLCKTRCILGYKHTLCKRLSVCWGRIFHLYGPHEQGNRLVSNIITSLLKTRKHYVQMENNREISSM